MKRGFDDSESVGTAISLKGQVSSHNLSRVASVQDRHKNDDSRCNLYEEDEVDDFGISDDSRRSSSQQNSAYMRSVQEAMSSVYVVGGNNRRPMGGSEIKSFVTEPLLSPKQKDDRRSITSSNITHSWSANDSSILPAASVCKLTLLFFCLIIQIKTKIILKLIFLVLIIR